MSAAEPSALHLVGVIRGGRRLSRRRSSGDGHPMHAARFRDLAVLLRPGPVPAGPPDPNDVLAHHEAVEEAMRRSPLVPARYGVVVGSRDDAVNLLREEYVALNQALALVGDRREFRLHAEATDALERERWLATRTSVYSELRRLARSAIPAPPNGEHAFTFSFLVDRASAEHFGERVEELRELHPELEIELTGPWPPYDFVKIEP